ncbi:MAG: acyl-CoA thioesterase [Lachnospiraceae bacterium]|jgi:acyl-CoA hydrolase|nr:acyl-CoA thioesterase [Lachnospiraceae bacterium]
MEKPAKRVSDSFVETIHVVRPVHINSAGRLFGGTLMQWMDEVAGLTSKRHTHGMTTTASVDNLQFLRAAYQSDIIVITGKITYVGNTSMEIRVETFIESRDGSRCEINRAYFTMVAIDENDKPARVPRLILETPEEKEEWANAEKRREMRKMRTAQGF